MKNSPFDLDPETGFDLPKVKQKIKMVWTCSDYINHEHKYKFTAWLCGRGQDIKRNYLKRQKL